MGMPVDPGVWASIFDQTGLIARVGGGVEYPDILRRDRIVMWRMVSNHHGWSGVGGRKH